MTTITFTDAASFARMIAPLATVPRIARCQSRQLRHSAGTIWTAILDAHGQVMAFSGSTISDDGAAHHTYLYAPDMRTYAALVAARDEAVTDAGALVATVVCRASRVTTLRAAGYEMVGAPMSAGGVATMAIRYAAEMRMAA